MLYTCNGSENSGNNKNVNLLPGLASHSALLWFLCRLVLLGLILLNLRLSLSEPWLIFRKCVYL